MQFVFALVQSLFTIYIWIIVIRAITPIIKDEVVFRHRGFFSFVASASDPLLRFVRRYIKSEFGSFDAAPLMAVVLVMLAQFGVSALFTRFLL